MTIEFSEPMVSISKRELDEKIADVRAEVAREIFEEMDEILLPLLHEVCQVYIYVKLKRKHTEADDGQSHT